jgi:DNA-binding FrmR family transcriptional regulator
MERERQQKEVLLRMKRIEGQIRGLQRMVEQGVPCADILTQMAAATAAMKKAGMVMIEAYMEKCLNKTKQGPSSSRGETVKDFQKALSRYMGWA